MENFNKTNLNQIDQFKLEFIETVKALESKHNVTISLGRISYGVDHFHGKLEVKLNPTDGRSIEQSEFEKNCRLFGLSKEHFKHPVQLNNGDVAYIIGINLSKRKFPIAVITKDKRKYGMTASSVLNQINNIEKL